MAQVNSDIKYLTPIAVDTKRKKYCRFRKSRIKYIDYKDANFLLKFVNEQGRILPRRITGTSTKFQKKVASYPTCRHRTFKKDFILFVMTEHFPQSLQINV